MSRWWVIAACVGLLQGCAAAETVPARWNPLARQEREPDTLYLLDVAAEQRLEAGDGGLISGDAGQEWTKVVPVPGKYRTGLKCADSNRGFLWMPSIGLISPDEFTIEFWLKCDRPWAEVVGSSPLMITDERGSDDLRLQVNGGSLKLVYAHLQDPAGPVSAEITYSLRQHPVSADTWVNVAFTLKEQTLRLYLNGLLVGEKGGLRPPRVWSDAARSDGLSLLGGLGRGAVEFALSDLRISRYARTPGEPAPPRGVNSLAVDMTRPTGQTVRQSLLGGLHLLRGPETERMARGVLQVLRTDKLLVATPMKEGQPDAACPSAGVSGTYSYDWQVVDRTFDYYQQLGITPYISIDATPQLLGGSVAPFSGAKLWTALSATSGFPREVPSDIEAFGTIVRDLVYHVVREKGYPVSYWGIWNEPDGQSFWNDNLDDYLRLYAVCARAVKSVSSDLRVGGPESGDWNPEWTEGLIRFCATEGLPLDFISWHYYQNTLSEIPQARAQVEYWARQEGLSGKPELIIGEWCWQIHNFPGSGYLPWKTRNYYLNDWHAAFVAASLIEMQNAGVVYSIYTNPVAESGSAGFAASGLMSSTHPWANLNVFRMWSMLAPVQVATAYDGPPGVFVQASRDDQGRLTVLLAHLRYRKDVTVGVTLRINGLADGARVTHYVVDDQHSNAFDAGSEHAELESVAPPGLKGSELVVNLRPRSVHLLVLDPAGR
jgi:hypothetical protein